MIRRSLALCLVAFIAIGCAQLGAGAGEPQKADASGLAGILSRGELRIGMTGEQPPLNMTTKSGELVGLEVVNG